MTQVNSTGGGNPNATLYLNYDALGNIQNKSDVGAYKYGALGAGPHAATTVSGTDYTYDANGNLKHAGLIGGRTYTWSSYNLPTELKASGGADIQFEYGPDREKVRQVTAKGSTINGVRHD